MESMGQVLQGNPQLWGVAGDLFVKNMDWPGAQELAKRLAKTIDPKLISDDEDPAMQAARQQIEAMAQEMQQMASLLQNVQQSMEAQKLEIDRFKAETDAEVKSYEAETRRLQAVAAGMQPEQVQEVVMQTLRDVMTAGDMAIAQERPV
jgi:ABC-type phosphate transport system auxiliary subunit